MFYQFLRFSLTYKRYGNLLCLYFICLLCISLKKTGITINLIKIINTYIIFRTFIFNDIKLTKNLSNVFP